MKVSKYNLQTYSSRVDYLNYKTNILDEGNDFDEGIHNFNFTHQLPVSLPTTFKSKFASIKYKMQVSVNFEHSELFLERPFIVIHPNDLNSHAASIGEPLNVQLEKSFNFNITSCDLSMNVVIPQKGYCGGQIIEILTQIQNFGRVRVKYVKIRLKKILIITRLGHCCILIRAWKFSIFS
jgi:hypothetical protein